MSPASYQVPAPLGKILSRLPAYPGSVLFAAGLNLALARHLPADTLRLLDGRKLRIQVRDAGVAFDFIWRDGSFSAARHGDDIALTISASAHDFFLVAQRKEDPDTLFFSRRLVMEGDTELGLLVKNTLDAIDLSVFSPGNFLAAHLPGRAARAGKSSNMVD
ncbi:ubiquinone anaerobic biosynthesis accessory factor UbiT [Pollutimonas bauzanensis]|uniref:Ubiquinone biosynthesis accessory factor UbiT n=1 Tax=Pollutimonas bauzanensis TaxID=658167 RepID=A0A1M5XQV0_9BURK|nr:SCP2 sterol-binding domain-containing protein [Pollutimonas bauzanensis]SHI02207.1 Predicted lipid carrier protein YhbT, contains SCP2 domain [Pollutimonas bauzanensis]